MARPQRNNVDYFPFYCEDGKKMFYLEETYGNDGFATFMKLLRELAKTDFHYLDLSKSTTTMFLSARCKVSKETLEAIINDLVELEKFDSVLWSENRIVWCQDFVNSIQDAYSKRSNECITYKGLLLLLQGLGVRKPIKQPSTVPVKPQSIVEETKEKESIIEPDLFETFWKLYDKGEGRVPAQREWFKVEDAEYQKIIEHAPKYVIATPEKKYRKKAENYLKDRTWQDEELPKSNIQPEAQKLTHYKMNKPQH
jgi:hypothetical protein